MRNLFKILVLIAIISLISCAKEEDQASTQKTDTTEQINTLMVEVLNYNQISDGVWSGSSAGFDYLVIIGSDTTAYKCSSVGQSRAIDLQGSNSVTIEAVSRDTSTFISIAIDNGSIMSKSKAKHSASSTYLSM